MIGLASGALKIYVALEPCDMRNSFNALYAVVVEKLKEDPQQGALFVFTNNRLTVSDHGKAVQMGIKEMSEIDPPMTPRTEQSLPDLEPDAFGLLRSGSDQTRSFPQEAGRRSRSG